jgi:hypothetical protein
MRRGEFLANACGVIEKPDIHLTQMRRKGRLRMNVESRAFGTVIGETARCANQPPESPDLGLKTRGDRFLRCNAFEHDRRIPPFSEVPFDRWESIMSRSDREIWQAPKADALQ